MFHSLMQGVEYELVLMQPPSLFVIEKRLRKHFDSVESLARYYVANAIIYQAPDLRSVITARMVLSRFCSVCSHFSPKMKGIAHLKDAFDAIAKEVEFSETQGHSYSSPTQK